MFLRAFSSTNFKTFSFFILIVEVVIVIVVQLQIRKTWELQYVETEVTVFSK